MIQQVTEQIFVGSCHHALDEKRRLIVPAHWRGIIGESRRLFVFPHPDQKCLYFYTSEEMGRRLRRLRASTADPDDQRAIRSFTAGGDAVAVDAQGRVRIKDELLAHAEVKGKVVLVGTLTRIELWSEENFDLALPAESHLADETFYGGY